MASGLFFTLLFCGLLFEATPVWLQSRKVQGCKCPDGWTKHEQRCYVFIADQLPWSNAETFCTNIGGNLVSFHSLDEYDYLRDFIKTESGTNARSWVGGSDAAKEGVWMWSDGSAFDYTHWGAGEPNNRGNEDCMEINFRGKDYVNDAKCYYKHPFVCAKYLKKCFSCP